MKVTYVLAGLLLLLGGCSKTTKTTPSGMEFEVLKSGDGEVAKPNQIVVYNFKFTDSKDSVWADTYKDGMPTAMMVADTAAMKTENGMLQMFRMIKKGDSVSVKMSISTFFNEMLNGPVPDGIDSTLSVDYRLRVVAIMDMESYREFQTDMMEKQQSKQIEKDGVIIDNFLRDKGINAQKAESGIRYVVTQPGTGENAQPGQTALVNYVGYTLEGEYFDSSIKALAEEKGFYNPMREPYEPLEVTIDQSRVIRGWHEALKVMNVGSKITVYIPSSLAYGPQQRSEIIGPNQILVFDLEMVNLQ